jgi:hypothetical protein
MIAVVALLAAGSAAWAAPAEIAPHGACPEISRAVARLATAEHQQAFALDLYSKADGGPGPHRGALPAVEVRLATMLDRVGELRATLNRVRSEPRALGNAIVRECLEVGDEALRQGERVNSEVERIVIEARGYPPAGAASAPVRSGAPAGRASGPAPPADAGR